MSEPAMHLPADPTTAPFWEAAGRHQLVVQRCLSCGHAQLYPRPHCLRCQAVSLAWTEAAGTGSVVSATTVHMQVRPDLQPPYVVALVQLDEGPRLLTHLTRPAPVGAPVRIAWRERQGEPPVPVFFPTDE